LSLLVLKNYKKKLKFGLFEILGFDSPGSASFLHAILQ